MWTLRGWVQECGPREEGVWCLQLSKIPQDFKFFKLLWNCCVRTSNEKDDVAMQDKLLHWLDQQQLHYRPDQGNWDTPCGRAEQPCQDSSPDVRQAGARWSVWPGCCVWSYSQVYMSWMRDYQVDKSSEWRRRTPRMIWDRLNTVEQKTLGKTQIITWRKPTEQPFKTCLSSIIDKDISKISVPENLRRKPWMKQEEVSQNQTCSDQQAEINAAFMKFVECITKKEEVDEAASKYDLVTQCDMEW